MYARMGDLAEKVTKALQGSSDSRGGSASKGTQASVLKKLSEADAIKKVGALFTADALRIRLLTIPLICLGRRTAARQGMTG